MSMEGFLEGVETLQIRGWAYDPGDPGQHVGVELRCNGVPLGRVRANIYREDLERAGVGDGDHAFIYNCPRALTAEELEGISAFTISADGSAIALDRFVAPAGPPPVHAALPDAVFQGLRQDDEHRPVFILGAARSGTSAIVQGLMSTTRYKGHEEGHFLDILAALYVRLQEFYDSKADELSRFTMIARVPADFVRDSFRNMAISAARQIFPDGYWVEKTPNSNMVHIAPVLREIWPQARFIFMKRRAIENLQSRQQKFSYDFERNCREWVDAMEAWLSVRGKLQDAALELDQFFLYHHPVEAASQISRLLALSDVEALRLGQILGKVRPQQQSDSLATPLCLEQTGWNDEKKARFHVICGPMMRVFNYSFSDTYHCKPPNQSGAALV